MDVYAAAISIGEKEGLNSEEMALVKTAALYHDAGFIVRNEDHEENSCRMAQNDLPDFGFSADQIAAICDMIMATRVPQSPSDHLSCILCDADLDYLGRSDFERIGSLLYQEFLLDGIVRNEDEWDELQVRFLTQHSYYTDTNKRERAPKKKENLQFVIERMRSRK